MLTSPSLMIRIITPYDRTQPPHDIFIFSRSSNPRMTVTQRAPMSFPQHHIFFSHHHITPPQHPSHPILTFTVRNHTSATRHPENMSFKRKMVKANEEEVLFQCLCCHQTNFRGKRNKLTKELKASSLLKHMKQKKSRSGEYECLRCSRCGTRRSIGGLLGD